MPVQDLFISQATQDKHPEEKAIARAVDRYFEKAAPGRPAAGGALESSIRSALHRYFRGGK